MTCLSDYEKFVHDAWFLGDSKLGGMPEGGYLPLCIAGEAGELADKVKKVYRDHDGKMQEWDVRAVIRELGDLLYYLTRYGQYLGYSLDTIMLMNVEKLQGRMERGTMRGEGDNR